MDATTSTFDPTAPLPGAPDPWDYTTPTPRNEPPYHMTEMIAAEPHLARRLLGRLSGGQAAAGRLAGVVGQAATSGEPVVVTGCGTSEHAAMAIVDILRDAMRASGMEAGPGSVVAAQAFELSLDPPSRGLVIGVSHEGGTAATNRAIAASAAAGAQTAMITASAGSPAAQVAETVVATGELDQSWCHTVGYLSPILAGAAVGAHLSGDELPIDKVAELLAAGAADGPGSETIAARLADARTLLVVGSGADRPAARELALKIEEASWLPSTMRDLETLLHGHLPAADESTALVLILADRAGRTERVARARQALTAARVIGLRSAAILSREVAEEIADDLTPAGRLVVGEAPELPAASSATLATATALQLLTERLARARGTNPDLIRREDPRYRDAAAAAD